MNKKIMFGYYIARNGIDFLWVFSDQNKSILEYKVKSELENSTPETVIAIGKYLLGDNIFRDINKVKIVKKYSNRPLS